MIMANDNFRKFLWVYCMALGILPSPFESTAVLQSKIKTALIGVNQTLDPEMPDGYLSIVLPILRLAGWDYQKMQAFVAQVTSLDPQTGNPANGSNLLTAGQSHRSQDSWGVSQLVSDIQPGGNKGNLFFDTINSVGQVSDTVLNAALPGYGAITRSLDFLTHLI